MVTGDFNSDRWRPSLVVRRLETEDDWRPSPASCNGELENRNGGGL
nr:hypothetical protein Itr_chr05CG17360 [Ipomoea trifida]